MTAKKSANDGSPYYVPPEPKPLPSFLLAVAVHAALLAFLAIGVSWQKVNPVSVEAEVWDMSVQTAAAPELPPEPAPEPEPQPEPAPEPPPPPPPPETVVERPAPTPDPEIALREEKKRKEEEAKKAAAEEKKRKEAEEKKREEAAEKKREEAEQKKRDEAEKKKLEEAERKKNEAAEKKKADAAAAEKKKKEAAAAKAEAAKLEKFRQEELKRMAGAMGSTGTAVKSTGPRSDGGYIAAITAAIKSATAYPGNTDVAGNPRATFRVEQLPTGEIMSVRLVKSSGVPEFDRAVENGIKKASPLPKKKDGTVERTLDVNFSMKDYD
ncbi:cell envelope integrity protein TolA [Massilia sp. CFBP9026]|uniref:cell envelope integrity protein TolA n=1 Tax=Massilia sp. CFBP9026 TaxID=3096536 RepID=UPI002A698844|nr:cell envelope integrity protein TolA [Massilia sp. CFBP9026]MDY0964322.1 cell envelope integrity protein TolA [Massilia sp. CFBP9026]